MAGVQQQNLQYSFKGKRYSSTKISKFCALFQNYQHCFEKQCKIVTKKRKNKQQQQQKKKKTHLNNDINI